MRERADGVKERYVFSMGEHHLIGFGVPFEELAQRSLTSLDYLVKIVYCSHSEITSIVDRWHVFLPTAAARRRVIPSYL
jgi:hypothetical protein